MKGILVLSPKKIMECMFNDDTLIKMTEIDVPHIPQDLTPFEYLATCFESKDYSDPDFPPTEKSICSDELNVDYAEYRWKTYSDIKNDIYYILPIGQEIDLVFQEFTPLHLIEMLNILSRDSDFIRSMIKLPES